MSSRSSSPVPPSSSGFKSTGPESGGGGGGTLSNDALYAPLSTYADCSTNHDDGSATVPSKKKNRHSLSLQTKSSLRESSLITFLTSMSQNLKSTHPHEYQLYRGMGGAIARYGMGDTDRASGSMRSTLEGKLLNRSLVLVGGGVHSHSTASSSSKSLGNSSNGREPSKEIMGAVGLAMAHAASSHGKRVRKRVGGNGMFGCISNKKRKKILREVLEKQSSAENENSELKIMDGGDHDQKLDASKEEKDNDEGLGKANKSKGDANPTDAQKNVGAIVETLHQMWTNYMQQLLSPMKNGANIISNTTTTDSPSLSLEDRKQISLLLATSEHVGMPATIVECPSRRHLVSSRCIVVNETKETWQIAMIVRKRTKSQKDYVGGKVKEVIGMLDASNEKKHDDKKASTQQSHLWKIVMVPKRRTALEVDLSWNVMFASNTTTSQQMMNNRHITVRLEN